MIGVAMGEDDQTECMIGNSVPLHFSRKSFQAGFMIDRRNPVAGIDYHMASVAQSMGKDVGIAVVVIAAPFIGI